MESIHNKVGTFPRPELPRPHTLGPGLEEIWSSTLTTGFRSNHKRGHTARGFVPDEMGSLSDDDFRLSSTDYEIERLSFETWVFDPKSQRRGPWRYLVLELAPSNRELFGYGPFTLQVGGVRYPFSEAMLKRLRELADFQKVFEAEILVSQYLEEGRDVAKLRHTLAHIMLREDAELHMFQVLEAAFRHYDLSDDPEEKRVHLLAATRYITAQKVMKNILWATENAERLQRGELLSEREDDD